MSSVPLVINGQSVPEQVLDDELLRVSHGLEMDSPTAGGLHTEAVRSIALQKVIRRILLCQAAIAEGLNITDAEAETERARRWGSRNNLVCGPAVHEAIIEDLLVERIGTRLTRHVLRPSRGETEAVYRRNRHLYLLPEAVYAAHIVRNIAFPAEEQQAEDVLKQAEAELARGTAFARVADRFSDCKGVGGSVGWIARGQMVAEFEDVVFALSPGSRSDIFRTIFGLHIATVLKKRARGYRPFDEVRPEIAAHLLAERRQEALVQAVNAMERASDIHFTEGAFHV